MTSSSQPANKSWASSTSGRRSYRIGALIAVMTSIATVWTTIVRDDGNGIGYLLLVMAAAVGAFAAAFRASGLARTMVGVAIMQLLLGMLVATAPSTALLPGGSTRVLVSSVVFAMLWLASAAFFRAAGKLDDA